MEKQFYKVKLKTTDKYTSINASYIMAVHQLEEKKFRIFLSANLKITADIAKRICKLAGNTNQNKLDWDVESDDLAHLFGDSR